MDTKVKTQVQSTYQELCSIKYNGQWCSIKYNQLTKNYVVAAIKSLGRESFTVIVVLSGLNLD